ncbi:MAG: HAD-IA family hydrolase [Magnetospiraceae bacterium]
MSVAKKPLRLMIFDLDGTLVDSQETIVATMHETCDAVSLPRAEAAAIRRVVGLSLFEAMARLFPGEPESLHRDMEETYRRVFLEKRSAKQVLEPFFPGALETLHAADTSGWLLGLATGKAHRGVVSTLGPHGVLDRFITIQTADRALSKPNPDMIYKAMRDTGADPVQTVMVGDTTFDMEMARSAGVSAIGVDWGYHETQELLDQGAQCVVTRFEEVLPAAERLLEETSCAR